MGNLTDYDCMDLQTGKIVLMLQMSIRAIVTAFHHSHYFITIISWDFSPSKPEK